MKIKAFIKRPGEAGHMSYISDTLKNLQNHVDGYIETVTMGHGVVLVCNEEGRINGMPYNCHVMDVGFYGTILILGFKGDRFTDIPLTITQVRQLITMEA